MSSLSCLTVPVAVAGILFFIGLTGPWRRMVGYLVCTYAAIVLASQHYLTLTGLLRREIDLAESSLTWSEQGTVVFAVVLVVAFIGLLVVYGVVWRPRLGEGSGVDGWSSLMRGAVCALTGWVLGAILVAAILTVSGIDSQLGATDGLIYRGAVFGVNELTGYLVRPWVPGELPPLLK